MTGKLPLSGIRVLDFTVIWAGPYGVMLLSDMGAEVIRVETRHHHIPNTRGFYAQPPREMVANLGSLARLYAGLDPKERPWDRHALFNGLGRNRYSMTVDLRRPEGLAVLDDLVKVSDIILDNNTNHLLESFGLGYQRVRTLNPTLIHVAMPIFGLSGPYSEYLGFGSNAEALGGFSSMRRYVDGDPTTVSPTNHMDGASGIGAAYAALMALYERDRTGRGQLIEFCQIEHVLHQIGGPLMDAAMNGRAQDGIGDRDEVRAPQGMYPCGGDDRWIAVSVGTDAEWMGLCKAMGRPELAADPAYEGNLARQRRHDHLDGVISDWTRTQDPAEATRLLQEHGVPAGTCANDRDVYESPQLEARGFFHWKEHAECGRHRYPGHSFKYSATPLRFDTAAPTLGQHNDLVYRQLLGLPDSEVQRLTELGHIGTTYSEEAFRAG